MAKYSIIVPVYNSGIYLSECIQSICSQNYSDFELLLIDDGSTDNSFNIYNHYISGDSRIKVFHQNNQGVSVARNCGIQNATGEWILFVDSDDSIRQGMLKTLDDAITLYKNAEYFCYAYDGVNTVEKISLNTCREELIMATLKIPKESSAFASVKHLASVWNKAFKKSLLKRGNIKFSTELVMGEDMIFNIEVQLLADDIIFIPGDYYYYRININSASRGCNLKIPKRDLIFQRKLNELVSKYNLNEIRKDALLQTTLGGILVCCNSCFFMYPIKHYIRYHSDIKMFLTCSIYSNALRQLHQCSGLKGKNKIILYFLKYHLYMMAFSTKKCRVLCQKVKEKLKR